MSITAKVKKLVTGTRVRFRYYRQGSLWYEVLCQAPDTFEPFLSVDPPFLFPVPISDTADATFTADDKALIFMRYIRKHVEELEAERATYLAPLTQREPG